MASKGRNDGEIGGFVTCNDALIGKVDLAEVCLRLRPDWPSVIRMRGLFLEGQLVTDSWLTAGCGLLQL